MAWRAQKTHIDRSKGTIEERRSKFEDLGPEPTAPLRPILTLGESTAEGLTKHLPSLPGALGIFSAEGGQFLGGHGFSEDAMLRTIACFSQFWDGIPVRGLRAGTGLIDNPGRRLACHLMIQPHAALSVLANPTLRDQGFLARFLIAAPETLAGTRFWKEPAEGTEPALSRFIARIMSIFEAPIETANAANELTPRVIELCPEARAAWIDFSNAVEAAMAPDGYAAGLRDVAGKSAEQAARIAGVLTLVDDRRATEIDGDAMLRAIDIASWYLDEAVKLAADVKAAPVRRDAEALKQWIIAKGLDQVTATAIMNRGPGSLRRKAVADKAIDALVEQGWLTAVEGPTRSWIVKK